MCPGGAAPPSNRMQLAKAPMNWRAGPPGGSPSGPGGLGPVSAAEWSSSPRAHSPLVVRIPSPHAKEHHVLNPTPRMVMTKHPSQSQIGPHREQVRWSHVGTAALSSNAASSTRLASRCAEPGITTARCTGSAPLRHV